MMSRTTTILAVAATAVFGMAWVDSTGHASSPQHVPLISGRDLDRTLQADPRSAPTPPHVDDTVLRIMQTHDQGTARVTEANVSASAKIVAIRIFGSRADVQEMADDVAAEYGESVTGDGYQLLFAHAENEASTAASAL